MTDRCRVFTYADDPILLAGLSAQLRAASALLVTDDLDEAVVVVIAGDRIDEAMLHVCRGVTRPAGRRVVIVAAHLDEAEIAAGVEAGASGFLRRAEAHVERLTSVVLAVAAGDGSVPQDLIGPLLAQMSRWREQANGQRGVTLSGFTARELEVLRYVAEGMETSEIAQRLCYSERTVKGIVHEITTRFQLKNRAQAVAYAMRQGVI